MQKSKKKRMTITFLIYEVAKTFDVKLVCSTSRCNKTPRFCKMFVVQSLSFYYFSYIYLLLLTSDVSTIFINVLNICRCRVHLYFVLLCLILVQLQLVIIILQVHVYIIRTVKIYVIL